MCPNTSAKLKGMSGVVQQLKERGVDGIKIGGKARAVKRAVSMVRRLITVDYRTAQELAIKVCPRTGRAIALF